MEEKIDLREVALKAIGYDPLNLFKSELNNLYHKRFKMRALFKLMLFVHHTISFPRHFDPDLEQCKRNKKTGIMILTYDPQEILVYRIGNCSTYATLFEALVKALGFEVRHIGLKCADRIRGHWCSEVLVEGKWCFFDPMYLVCPINLKKGKEGYSAWEIVENPDIYISDIPKRISGISVKTWKEHWAGLEINKISSHNIGIEKFIEMFYKGEK